MSKNKKSIFSKISTKPSPDSLKWAGTQYSLLSNVLLWTLWICRVFSLLQICKYLFRTIATAIKKGTTDKNATRVNVPPMLCEIYFCVWFVVILLGYLLAWTGLAFKIATIYYLFESIVWILYYTVFRRFFEENYSIYHELEYFTVLILVIPTDALAFACYYNQTFGSIIAGLLSVGADDAPTAVKLVGALFTAIVISMILTTFPSEKLKVKAVKTKMHVIGGGDVVQNRLYSALIDSGVDKSNVKVYDLDSANNRIDDYNYFSTDSDITDAITTKIKEDDVIWIETPPKNHVAYLEKLISSKASLIVMEKPICICEEDLKRIEEYIENDETRSKIFFLSYYLLEKALPLFYIAQPNANYEKYLDVEDSNLIQNCRTMLGALNAIDVVICEGEDQRSWVNDDKHGGQLLETFIHNVLIATLFCGIPQYWQDVKLDKKNEDGLCDISLSATCGHTNINLVMKKNVAQNEKKRNAKMIFSNGSIEADFDTQSAIVKITSLDTESRISVKHRYMGKYMVLVDLVKTAREGTPVETLDGLKNQIPTIRWLLNLSK